MEFDQMKNQQNGLEFVSNFIFEKRASQQDFLPWLAGRLEARSFSLCRIRGRIVPQGGFDPAKNRQNGLEKC